MHNDTRPTPQPGRHTRVDRLRILGNTLFDLRTFNKLTVSELGTRSGIHYTSIRRIERGTTDSPGIETLNSLASALDVPLCRLFDQSHILPDPLHADPEIQALVVNLRQLSARDREEARRYLLFMSGSPTQYGEGRKGRDSIKDAKKKKHDSFILQRKDHVL